MGIANPTPANPPVLAQVHEHDARRRLLDHRRVADAIGRVAIDRLAVDIQLQGWAPFLVGVAGSGFGSTRGHNRNNEGGEEPRVMVAYCIHERVGFLGSALAQTGHHFSSGDRVVKLADRVVGGVLERI
jgi:hypothetical protein